MLQEPEAIFEHFQALLAPPPDGRPQMAPPLGSISSLREHMAMQAAGVEFDPQQRQRVEPGRVRHTALAQYLQQGAAAATEAA